MQRVRSIIRWNLWMSNNFLFGKEDEIQVICQSGGRSMKVCQKLEAAGYSNVVNVEGELRLGRQVDCRWLKGRK